MWFHRRHTVRHSLWFAAKSVILFSAITHLLILSYVSLASGDSTPLHYLDIIDVDLIFGSDALIGHWGVWLTLVSICLVLLYHYDQKHE